MDIGWLNVQSLRRKTDAVQQTITEQSLDVLVLTEHGTAITIMSVCILAPAGYAVVDSARKSGQGGGVAIIFRQNLKCSLMSLPACSTMELICIILITASGPVVIDLHRRLNVRRCCSPMNSNSS